jgi:hypothetical protein
VSSISHATGAGSRVSARDQGGARETESTLDVTLAHARWRNFLWAAIWLALGGFLVLRLGSFGLVVGIPILLAGINAAVAFTRTLLHPPGTISVRDAELLLPARLCSGTKLTVPKPEIRHAYLLRRSVPLARSGPVLVVETAQGTYSYPRDWFTTEADQRRVATSINRQLGRLS